MWPTKFLLRDMDPAKDNIGPILPDSRESLPINSNFWQKRQIKMHQNSTMPISATICLSTATQLTRSVSRDMKWALKDLFLAKSSTCRVLADSTVNPLIAMHSKTAKGRDLLNAWWRRCLFGHMNARQERSTCTTVPRKGPGNDLHFIIIKIISDDTPSTPPDVEYC